MQNKFHISSSFKNIKLDNKKPSSMAGA